MVSRKPRAPQWELPTNVFRTMNIRNKRQTCVICLQSRRNNDASSRYTTFTLHNFGSERSLFMQLKYKLLIHPSNEKICGECNKIETNSLIWSIKQYHKFRNNLNNNNNKNGGGSFDDLFNFIDITKAPRWRNNVFAITLSAIIQSHFFNKLLGDKFDPKPLTKKRIFTIKNMESKKVKRITNIPTEIQLDITKQIVNEIFNHGYNISQIEEFCFKKGASLKEYFLNKKINPLEDCNHHPRTLDQTIEMLKQKRVYSSKLKQCINHCIESVGKCLFYFLVKSKRPQTSHKELGVYHQYWEGSLRRHFHLGRILVSTFFRPYHFGMTHLQRPELETKQSNWTVIIESIAGMKVMGMLDSTKLKQVRFFHYDSDYRSYDVSKHRPMRGYVGIDTTSGYNVDFIGGNVTHGRSGDSHLFNWITKLNVENFNDLFNYKTDLLAVDRGYKYCFTNTPYWLLMPSIYPGRHEHPTPCFLINCSRLITMIRWIKEVSFGQYAMRWGIFRNDIIAHYKKYIDPWIKNIISIENYLKPNGWVNDLEIINNKTLNFMIYQIKTQFFANRLKLIWDKIMKQHSNTKVKAKSEKHKLLFETTAAIILRLVPGMKEVIKPITNEELEVLGGGPYCFKQSPSYMEHNIREAYELMEDPTWDPELDAKQEFKCRLFISKEQIDYDHWVDMDEKINQMEKEFMEAELNGGGTHEIPRWARSPHSTTFFENLRKQNDQNATRNCEDDAIIVCVMMAGRHTRSKDPTTWYSTFIGVDMKRYKENAKHEQYEGYDWKSGFETDDGKYISDIKKMQEQKENKQPEFLQERDEEQKEDEEEEEDDDNIPDMEEQIKENDISNNNNNNNKKKNDKRRNAKYVLAQNSQYLFLFGKYYEISQLQFDEDLLEGMRHLKYIYTIGECPVGERTIALCAHRITAVRLLRDIFQEIEFVNPHPESKLHGLLLNDPEFEKGALKFDKTKMGEWWRSQHILDPSDYTLQNIDELTATPSVQDNEEWTAHRQYQWDYHYKQFIESKGQNSHSCQALLDIIQSQLASVQDKDNNENNNNVMMIDN